MPMMCLAAVAVAAKLVVEEVSTLALVQEAATMTAEEVDIWQGGWRLCSVNYFSPIFFAFSSHEAHSGSVVLVAVADGLSSALASDYHCCHCRFHHRHCFCHHHHCCHYFFCCPFWLIVVCALYCRCCCCHCRHCLHHHRNKAVAIAVLATIALVIAINAAVAVVSLLLPPLPPQSKRSQQQT